MKQQRRITSAITIIPMLILGGCFQDLDANGNPGTFTPRPMFLGQLPRDNDDFSKGFREGCYNFIGQAGYGINRMFDKPADPNIAADDHLYWDGYRSGDRYCSVYVNRDINL